MSAIDEGKFLLARAREEILDLDAKVRVFRRAIERLRVAIEDAPHGAGCASRVRRSYAEGQLACDCWRGRALGDKP